MPSIPHSFNSALAAFAAPLAGLLIALLLPLLARGKGWAATTASMALFAGWALLQPVSLLPRVIWAPHRGAETLLAPALACVAGMALVAWRGGRQSRLVAVLMAGFAGWWVARDGVGAADFWRVWFGVAVLAALLSRVMRARADRLLMIAAALWGALGVAGAGSGFMMAALVAAAAAAGLLASSTQAVPAAAVAALIGATDLAGGRLLRGHLDAIDLACLAALLAPSASDLISKRLNRLPNLPAAILSGAIGVAGAVAAVWLLRRALFT